MVLAKWLEYLEKFDVHFQYEHKLVDFSSEQLKMESHDEVKTFSFRKIIFALGGASWSKTGSTGDWLNLFRQKNIICNSFQSSNSGVVFQSGFDLKPLEGQYIKNCKVFSNSFERLGDITITKTGLEGAPTYALNKEFRIGTCVFIDFKPTVDFDKISKTIVQSKNNTEGMRKLKLSKTSIAFLKLVLEKEQFKNPEILANSIKKLKIPFASFQPIDEVISTIGGVSFDSVLPTFELLNVSNVYCVGEMLDWDAPTGGYLIQACVASGYSAGKSIVNHS
jgi:predicted Rossmann fold flavoprotein